MARRSGVPRGLVIPKFHPIGGGCRDTCLAPLLFISTHCWAETPYTGPKARTIDSSAKPQTLTLLYYPTARKALTAPPWTQNRRQHPYTKDALVFYVSNGNYAMRYTREISREFRVAGIRGTSAKKTASGNSEFVKRYRLFDR